MATYREIQSFVKSQFGFVPKTCWIAHMKELSGIPVKKAHNRAGASRQVPCPNEKRDAIRKAFKHFGMLALLIMVLFPSTSNAEPFSLRVFTLGMTIEEFRKTPYPNGKKGSLVFCTNDKNIPIKIEYDRYLYVGSRQQKLGIQKCSEYYEGPIGLWSSYFDIVNMGIYPEFSFISTGPNNDVFRLFKIQFTKLSSLFDILADAHKAKYGKPDLVETATVQNAMGAKFSSRIYIWKRDNSSITITERFGKVNKMMVQYLEESLIDLLRKRKEQMTKEASKTL